MLEISWTPQGGQEQVIDFDCLVSETHEGSAQVSDHVVEQGAAISDHVRPQNDSVTLEAVVSNHPLEVPSFGMDGATGSTRASTVSIGGQTSSVSTMQWSQAFDRRKAVDDQLRALKDAGQVVTVTTGTRVIENCVIERYRVERDADWGNSLHLNLDLRRIRIATTQRVRVPAPRQRRGQRQRNRGGQPGTDATEQQAAPGRSFLRGLGFG